MTDTTERRPRLIDVLNASCKGAAPPSDFAWRCYLRALVAEVLPEEPPPEVHWEEPEALFWHERQRIRALLLAEAERAERGDAPTPPTPEP